MIITISNKYFRKQHYWFVVCTLCSYFRKMRGLCRSFHSSIFDIFFFPKIEMGHFRGKPTIIQIWISTRKFFNHKVCCTRSCRNRLFSPKETWVKLILVDTFVNFFLRNSCACHIGVSGGMCKFIPHSVYCLLR
jgi:hypothetical protein